MTGQNTGCPVVGNSPSPPQWRGCTRVVSAPASPQFPELVFQRLPRRLLFSQTVLRLPQLALAPLQAPLGFSARLRLFVASAFRFFPRLVSFPVCPQILGAHGIIKVQRLPDRRTRRQVQLQPQHLATK